MFTLVLVNIQCVAFCTIESCDRSGTASAPGSAYLPPCHHHQAPGHQNPAPCSHHIIQAAGATAVVTPDLTAGDLVADLPVVSPFAFPPVLGVDIFPARASSLPGLDPISSVVLRI